MDEVINKKFHNRVLLAKYFCYLPYIRAIFLTGSVSRGKHNINSDIDLIVIAQSNRLYLAKFILQGLLRILNLAQTSQKKAGRYSLEDFWDCQYFNLTKLNAGLLKACKNQRYLISMTAVYNQHAKKRLEKAVFLNSRRLKFPQLNFFSYIDSFFQRKLQKHYLKDIRSRQSNFWVILDKDRIVIHPNDQILDNTIYV